MHGCQPHACALSDGFRGVERLEDVGQHFRRDACARVFHLQKHITPVGDVMRACAAQGLVAHAQGNHAAVGRFPADSDLAERHDDYLTEYAHSVARNPQGWVFTVHNPLPNISAK